MTDLRKGKNLRSREDRQSREDRRRRMHIHSVKSSKSCDISDKNRLRRTRALRGTLNGWSDRWRFGVPSSKCRITLKLLRNLEPSGVPLTHKSPHRTCEKMWRRWWTQE